MKNPKKHEKWMCYRSKQIHWSLDISVRKIWWEQEFWLNYSWMNAEWKFVNDEWFCQSDFEQWSFKRTKSLKNMKNHIFRGRKNAIDFWISRSEKCKASGQSSTRITAGGLAPQLLLQLIYYGAKKSRQYMILRKNQIFTKN